MGLIAYVVHALHRQPPQPQPHNDHARLLAMINDGRFLPATVLWIRLGRPSRRHLLRQAGYREKVTTFDYGILQFGRNLQRFNFVTPSENNLQWQPHWLMYANPARPWRWLH